MAFPQEPYLPVNVYRSDCRFMVVAPLPGVEPEDVEVEVAPMAVTIRTRVRGPGQERKDYVSREWHIGNHQRVVPLPSSIDPGRANVTYGNGVLTVVLPQVSSGPAGEPRLFRLWRVRWARGQFVGHQGHELRPSPSETVHRWSR